MGVGSLQLLDAPGRRPGQVAQGFILARRKGKGVAAVTQAAPRETVIARLFRDEPPTERIPREVADRYLDKSAIVRKRGLRRLAVAQIGFQHRAVTCRSPQRIPDHGRRPHVGLDGETCAPLFLAFADQPQAP